MPSVKKVMTPAMESCLSKIVSMSAIDDTKKDRKIRKKICKSYNVDFHEFEDRYNKFKSKGGLVTCPATRPSSSSEKDKRRRSSSRTGEKNGSDVKLKKRSGLALKINPIIINQYRKLVPGISANLTF